MLVKGMKFPENCGECPFDNGIYCTMYPESQSMIYDANDSLEWCPLVKVPDHGIIISADAIKRAADSFMEMEVSDGKPELRDELR